MTANFALLSIGLAVALFLAMMLMLEVGRRVGVERTKTRGNKARAGVGVVDGSVYGLLALLAGFMFSGAANRFDQRRTLVGEIANAAQRSWRRVALLPDELRSPVRDALRRYMDGLVSYYTGPVAPRHHLEFPPQLTQAEDSLWSRSVAACKAPGGEPARMLLLPALSETFDAVERERVARRIHPSPLIYVMFGISALATALFAGYGMASGPVRNWMYTVGIAASISIATYVIIELEYPRLGLVRVSGMDQLLVEARDSMK
ncbi:MAG TPA: hypothetical protein VGQ44_14980 [Gemmatimonadaceae bacterium]|nr:hypothetical protein [Gemmatimonadaceae bacterium]